jgi:hypothetical protein
VNEFRKAVEMGYDWLELLEFWENVTCFDASSVQSESDKDRYTEEYRRGEGIALDKQSIFKNAGQRTLAKLKLNSMLRKWAQNQTKPRQRFYFREIFYKALDKSGY